MASIRRFSHSVISDSSQPTARAPEGDRLGEAALVKCADRCCCGTVRCVRGPTAASGSCVSRSYRTPSRSGNPRLSGQVGRIKRRNRRGRFRQVQRNQQVREGRGWNICASRTGRRSGNFSRMCRLQAQKPKKNLRPTFFVLCHFFMFLRMVSGRCPPPRPLLAICREYQTSVMPGFSRLSTR